MASSTTVPRGELAPGLAARVRSAPLLVGMFFCADLFLLLLSVANKNDVVRGVLPVLKQPAFDVSRDLGMAETFGYVKTFWIVLLLAWLAARGAGRAYLPWTMTFGYLLVDDMLGVHERVGAKLVRMSGEEPQRLLFGGLRTTDLGELAVSGGVGVVLLAMLLLCYRRGTAATRATYRLLLLGTAALAGFGVLVDMVATGFRSPAVREVLHLVEDGGELVVISAILWLVYVLAEQARSQPSAGGAR